MNDLFTYYSGKLVRAGLAEAGRPLLGTAEELVAGNRLAPPKANGGATMEMPGTGLMAWNRNDPLTGLLTKVAERLGRRAILYCQPAEPYHTMLLHLTETADGSGVIHPQDFETRIFLKDLPILKDLNEAGLLAALKDRRCVVIPGGGFIATAKKDMETAFVIYSAACFAVFVKFFSDLLPPRQGGGAANDAISLLPEIRNHIDRCDNLGSFPAPAPPLGRGPFEGAQAIREAMTEAGGRTVAVRLVNANFGNISYRRGDELFITRRGSALDNLKDSIITVPLPGPAETDAIASIELPAHRRIVMETPYRAVLHGHPKFSVIMSMACDEDDCPQRGDCHRFCPRMRRIADIPVVSGEAGAGTYGLGNTVPPAVRDHGAAIVYGHGVFAAGKEDFLEAYTRLEQVEKTCKDLFFMRIGV